MSAIATQFIKLIFNCSLRVEAEAALRLEEELKVSVRIENVPGRGKADARSSSKGKNGFEESDKSLDVELPERKSSETRSDILGDIAPTVRKSSKEGELTANRKSHERKVHDSEALKKAKETEALRKAKESAEQEREAVKKEDERLKEEALKVRKAAEELSERKRSLERVLEKENVVPTPNITTISNNTSLPGLTPDPIKTSENKKLLVGKNNFHVTNERFLDMEEPLPEPPPTPNRSSSPIEISAPLIISTEPMSVSSSSANKSEDKSNCSTSFDSLDGSLDSGSGGWPEGGDWLGSEPHRDSVQSPGNSSTCSRSPPSPPPGATPTRHVMTDWDEFMEPNSGRKFYYNAKVTPIDCYRRFQKLRL